MSKTLKPRTTKKLLSTTALTVAGILAFTAVAGAKDVGDYDVWEFENIAPSEKSKGYVQYKGDRLVGNLTQEDIGALGHVDLQANLTVATGVEAGPMHILGKLTSTGRVFVLDVNGFLFGANSSVDTAGFAALGGEATNLNTLDTDNRLDVKISEGAEIHILEGAKISVADAGLAAFVAPVVKNAGVISAKMGKVVIGSAEMATLDLYGDNLVEIALSG